MVILAQTASAVSATGGNTTTDIGGYRIHTFTSSGTFTVSDGGVVDVLVVAGGGGGGSGGPGKDSDSGGGGGGAGGLIYSNAFSVNAGSIAVIVGAGGAGGSAAGATAVNGENSSFGALNAVGGGRGACAQTAFAAGNGGSGGGASFAQITRGNGTAGQGNQGGSSFNDARYAGGSGGGAGAAGQNSTVQYGNGLNGGTGVSQSVSGSLVSYAGGGGSGGGGWWTSGSAGGLGGGGAGGGGGVAGSAGIASTGGGGGGGGCASVNGIRPAGGNGGSGIVIVRYAAGAPMVANASAVVTASYVTLNGFLVSTGQDANVSAMVFFGTNDAGANMAGWTYTNRFPGWASEGPLSTNVTPSLAGARYYYRFFASNSFGSAWASPVGGFITLGPPGVNNAGGAVNVGVSSATLQGEVTGGSPAPLVWIYWGRTNQGVNRTLWEHEVPLGAVESGSFAATVDGLVQGATHYYRCYASNSYGNVWSPGVTEFMPGMGTVHYVNKANPSPISPYTSWAWAATNIQNAIDVAGSGEFVFVTNGDYDTGGRTAGSALTNRVVITNGVKVMAVSTNPADTLIAGAADTRGGTASNGPAAVRCVYIQNGCTLSGFTLTNGYTLAAGDVNGGGVYASAASGGLVTNCVIAKCVSYTHGGGGYQGLYRNCIIRANTSVSGNGAGLYGAVASGCLITANLVPMAVTWGSGGGVAACIVSNCTLSFNTGGNGNGYGGGGAYSSTLVDCMIVSNRGASFGGGMSGSSVAERCVFIGNGSPGTICGVMWGGSARNCLMINNSGGVGPWGWGTLVNCTVVSNVGGFKGDAATNCIIVGNTPYDSSDLATEGKYYYSCIGTIAAGTNRALGNNNIYGGSPQFVNPATGNYHLASGQSPCYNSGVNQTWMTNGVDLDGNRRIRNVYVDMGAYELWVKSGTFFRGR